MEIINSESIFICSHMVAVKERKRERDIKRAKERDRISEIVITLQAIPSIDYLVEHLNFLARDVYVI